MGLAELEEKVRRRFWEVPTYEDADATHTQTLMTAATHEVYATVTTVGAAAQLLQELDQLERPLDWKNEVTQYITGWRGVLESLQDIITAAIIVMLLRDAELAAEDDRRQANSE